jgi:hypothetical protein
MFTENQALYFVYFTAFSSASVWFSMLWCIVVAIIPDILLSVLEHLNEEKKLINFKYMQIIDRKKLLQYLRNKTMNNNNHTINESILLHNLPILNRFNRHNYNNNNINNNNNNNNLSPNTSGQKPKNSNKNRPASSAVFVNEQLIKENKNFNNNNNSPGEMVSMNQSNLVESTKL